MKYLKISNAGEIELNAFKLIGASTKRDDNTKIGFFGSGLKYAIAYLLNHSIEIKIFTGLKEVKLTTRKEPYRDKEFNIIQIDGEDTSLTTEMGPTWETWFALREIYCNALDEGMGEMIQTDEEPQGKSNFTSFYITINSEIEEILKTWASYFSEKRTDLIYENGDTKIFNSNIDDGILIAYRKGIRCYYEEEQKSLFHYDFPWVIINESRTIDNIYVFKNKLSKFFREEAPEIVISRLIKNINRTTFEKQLSWNIYYNDIFSKHWLDIIGNKILIPEEIAGWFLEELKQPHLILPVNLCDNLKIYFKDKVTVAGSKNSDGFYQTINTHSERQKFLLKEIHKFFDECKFDIGYGIEIVKFQDNLTLGSVNKDTKTILVSEKVFDMGKRELAQVIYEEKAHLDSGFSDETRNFQNFLIQKTISLMEEKAAYFL